MIHLPSSQAQKCYFLCFKLSTKTSELFVFEKYPSTATIMELACRKKKPRIAHTSRQLANKARAEKLAEKQAIKRALRGTKAPGQNARREKRLGGPPPRGINEL